MSMYKKSIKMKLFSLILASTVGIPFASCVYESKVVRAEHEVVKDISNTRLGVNGLADPRVPTSADDAWQGSYVYFGCKSDWPIRYRVLDKNGTSPYGGLFLDCDECLYSAAFDDENSTWNRRDCDMRAELNGSRFLTSSHCFSDVERNAIRIQNISSHPLSGIDSHALQIFSEFNEINYYPSYGIVTKVFLLDAEDILCSKYGYFDEFGWPYKDDESGRMVYPEVKNHQKGSQSDFWLRSRYGIGGDIGIIAPGGYICPMGHNESKYVGVSPAFSVDMSSILFSTVGSGTYGSLGAEYKLTIIDDRYKVSVSQGKKSSISGRTITVPYTVIEDPNRVSANHFSIMILDKEYVPGNANNATLLYYNHADNDITYEAGASGTASFTLPEKFPLSKWGQRYYVYCFMEQVRSGDKSAWRSDYACAPILLERPSDYVTSIRLPSDTSSVDLNQRQCDALVYLMTNNMVGCYINDKYASIDVDKDGVYDFRLVITSSVPAPAVRIINSPICGTYSFDVSKCTGSYLHEVKIRFDKPKPPMPTGLKGSADTSTSVKLTWDKASYADEYEVYRSTSIDGTYSKLGTVTESNRRCPGLTSGTKYYFKVRSVMIINSVKYYGDFTSPISVVPPFSAPSGVMATSSSNTAVNVSWNAVKGATGYVVYRSTSENGTYTRLGTVTGTSRKCTGLTSGKKYYFKVRAIVTYDGTTYYGKYSSPVSAIPPLPKPDYINVIPGATSTSALVYWNEVKGATGYVVYRSTSENGDYTRLGTVKTTDRTCTGLKKGQTYYFKVRAINVVDGKTCYGSYTAPKKYTVK